ncbi:MAG: DUF2628 domain-containing protein [Clostridia bacterium]|nr:DUF2628 domain-containing protein [Clostridia bacterium]
MRYTNQICDGCGKIFTADDDIVVCPECATPQHRECYKNHGGCVNSHKHGDSFTWTGAEIITPAVPLPEKTKTIPCPNCGYGNPEGSDHCKQCSMKFTLFGYNVVDASAREEEKEKEQTPPAAESNIPEYKPPFTLGEGEGFGQDSTPVTDSTPTRDEVEQKLIDVISSSSGFSPDGEDFSFGGPFPKEDKTCGVHTNLMGAFIGSSAMRYIEKFKRFDFGRKLSFNFAAFFFSPYWFFYRKLVKPGIIFMTVNLCLSIISTPALLDFVNKAMPLMERLAAVTNESDAATMLMELEALYIPVLTFMGVQFIVNLIAGFTANHLYKNYTVSSLKEIASFENQKNSMAYLLRKGGVAPLYALGAVLAENLLTSIVSMFM